VIKKRCEVIQALARGENVDKKIAEIDRVESQIKDDPSDLMYSEKREEIVSYRQKVLEIESDKDDFLFSLAGYKGETIESLGRKTLSEIMSFAERLSKDGRY
jgi:hypothetical protein